MIKRESQRTPIRKRRKWNSGSTTDLYFNAHGFVVQINPKSEFGFSKRIAKMSLMPPSARSGENGQIEEGQDDLQAFMNRLAEAPFNGKAGNKSLRDALRWADVDDRYWKAHGRALDQGLILPGRGKGGSVRIVEIPVDTMVATVGKESEVAADEKMTRREIDLYDSARNVINDSWVKAENYDDYIVSITALRGRSYTGGKWTRPDVSILAIKAYPYLPQRYFDIVTFEIKPQGQTNVEGVFEALSHQQFATRSFTVFHVPDLQPNELFQEKYPDSLRILSTARKYGIGVILATDIADWEAWDEILSAERVNPDPEQANRFIATGFPQEIRDKIIKWHK